MFQRKVNITRIKKNQKTDELDIVLIESPIDIILNSEPLVNIICLPKDLKEMAVGFLYSIGLIESIDDIDNIEVNELEGKILVDLTNTDEFDKNIFEINPVGRVIDTTCGIPSPWRSIIKDKLERSVGGKKTQNSFKIKSEVIFSSIIEMQKETRLFRETGGCHGAAIFTKDGQLISVKEDIGRHNAIDKVIGELLLYKNSFEDVFLTTTGRLTGDSVLKAVRAKIPIVASLSAAVESGIRLAFAYGLTLIGFVRGARMNIYTNPDRIII